MNSKSKIYRLCTSALLCTGMFNAPAVLAESEPARGESALMSSNEEYKPLGLRAGSFLLYPLIVVDGEYDDNIYSLPDDFERDDIILHIRPSISMQSNWNRHALNANADLDLAYYNDYSDEDYEDYNLSADGRFDMVRDSYASWNMGYSHLHEPRSSVDDRGGAEPTEYDFGFFGLGYDHKFNRMAVTVSYNYEMMDYDDVPAFLGGTINNDDRDRDRDEVTLRLGYEVRPQFAVYLEGALNKVDYDQQYDRSNRERSSEGYRAVAGVSMDITSVLVGDIYLGYLSQSYDDPYFTDVDDPAYGFGLTWYATDLTTVYGSLEQGPEETTEAHASGYLSTIFNASVDHALRRNVLLFGTMSYTDNEYETAVPGQKENENIFGIGGGVKYMFNRRFYSAAEYNYERRDSDIAEQEYEDNAVLLTVGAQW